MYITLGIFYILDPEIFKYQSCTIQQYFQKTLQCLECTISNLAQQIQPLLIALHKTGAVRGSRGTWPTILRNQLQTSELGTLSTTLKYCQVLQTWVETNIQPYLCTQYLFLT